MTPLKKKDAQLTWKGKNAEYRGDLVVGQVRNCIPILSFSSNNKKGSSSEQCEEKTVSD